MLVLSLMLSVVLLVGLADPGGAGPPRVTTTPAPVGMLPVAYGDAQIDVPSAWSLVADGASACGASTGVIVLGDGSWCPPSMNQPPRPGTTIVTLRRIPPPSTLPSGHAVRGLSAPGELAFTANGIRVYAPGVAPVFVAPALRTEITVSGPVPTAVLHSLSYSPRAVVLAPHPARRTPRSWRRISSAGLHLSVPPSWPVQRTTYAPGCQSDVMLTNPGVILASQPPQPVSCPLPRADTEPVPQVAGVEVDGFAAGPVSTCTGPHAINGLPVCIPAAPASGVLILVAHPRGRAPVTVKLGLFGRGLVDATILSSLS